MPTTHNTLTVQTKYSDVYDYTDASYEVDTPSGILHITTDNKLTEHIYNSDQWETIRITWTQDPNEPIPFHHKDNR